MRLTVGPLAASVYWRRRAVVLVGLAIVVLVVSYACGGSSSSGAQNTAATNPQTTISNTPPHPFVPSPMPTPSPTPTAFSLVTPAANGPCTDYEIELTATADQGTVAPRQTVQVTLKVKNISGRTCSRDVGADAQELRLQDASGIVWSSDDCSPRHGIDIRSYPPGKQDTFTVTWSGLRSRSGTGAPECSGTTAPAVGVYDLVARLDKKFSSPFALKIAAGSTGS
jgi:hypothetical protein